MKNGKYCNKKSLNKKPLALLLALVMLVGCVVGGTIAWLTAETVEVENTFTVGDINITLEETGTENNKKGYNFVPGDTLAKDPKVTVVAGSEACYLFVKVTVDNNSITDPALSTILHFDVESDWTQIDENGNPVTTRTDDEAFVDGTYYFYREVQTAGETYNVLVGQHNTKCATNDASGACNCDNEFKDGFVSIDTGVTKEMVKLINGDPEADPEIFAAKPVLKFDAAAVQFDNIVAKDGKTAVKVAFEQIQWN